MSVRRQFDNDKTVSFASSDGNDVYEIAHINDLKEETDIQSIWYTDEEYKAMVRNCQEIVQRMSSILDNSNTRTSRKPHDEDDDDWCIRGLELNLESLLERQRKGYRSPRRYRIYDSYEAVMDEQKLQRFEGNDDVELLADVYYYTSYKCQRQAERIGRQDEKASFRTCASDEKSYDPTS